MKKFVLIISLALAATTANAKEYVVKLLTVGANYQIMAFEPVTSN